MIAEGDRVRVISDSAFQGRCGTVVRVNLMPNRWMVSIDGDEKLEAVSFYDFELEKI